MDTGGYGVGDCCRSSPLVERQILWPHGHSSHDLSTSFFSYLRYLTSESFNSGGKSLNVLSLRKSEVRCAGKVKWHMV